MTGLLVGVVALGLLLTLVARYRHRLWLELLGKPLASTGFVVLCLHKGALDSSFGQTVLLALLLCWLGDVLLIGSSRLLFLGGLVSFLLGHLVLCLAFVEAGWASVPAGVAAAAMAVVSVLVLRWLWAHVPGRMRAPVVAYVVVISTMVALATGCAVHTARYDLLVAATCFFVSDIAVARDRFVCASFINRLWGLPLYYLAVVLFALSVAI